MPGKRMTDHQVLEVNAQRRTRTQGAAAAKAGISERSARRLESLESASVTAPARHWRARNDSLAQVWEPELLPLLRQSPQLSAVTLVEELQRRHPGDYGLPTLLTLQRLFAGNGERCTDVSEKSSSHKKIRRAAKGSRISLNANDLA